MRALGIAVSALCFASSPAFAGEGVALRGDAPLLLHDANTPTPVVGRTIVSDLRLRTAVVATRPSLLDDPQGRLHRRIASQMFDYYPNAASGFHLSAGVRYFDRTNFAIEAQKMTHGLLYAPNPRTGALRGGIKRFTPAVTAGYTAALTRNFMIGLEGGALLSGRSSSAMPQGMRSYGLRSLEDRSGGINPMATLVVGLRF
jgi:hypothetical protein